MRELLRRILDQYRLPVDGPHGVAHWGRVMENGLWLAAGTGARLEVVRLFALFHDACRESEGRDRDHGRRGAELADYLRGDYFELSDEDFDLLRRACELHTDGRIEGDITLITCWDADRLDLGRVGIRPDPARLCTELARTERKQPRFDHDRDPAPAMSLLGLAAP